MFGILLMLKSKINGAVEPWDDLVKGDLGEGEVEVDDFGDGDFDFGLLLYFGDNIDQNDGERGGIELFNLGSDMSSELEFLRRHRTNRV